VTLGVQLSKKKGCRTEIESPIIEGGVNLKTGDAVSSRNILFSEIDNPIGKGGANMKIGSAFST